MTFFIMMYSQIPPGLVAAAFASLNSPEDESNKKPSPKSIKQSRTQQLDSQISSATDINSLLLVAENPVVSRRHALKVSCLLMFCTQNISGLISTLLIKAVK